MSLRNCLEFHADPYDFGSANPNKFKGTEVGFDNDSEDEDYNPGGYEAAYVFEDELDILAVLRAQELTPDDDEFDVRLRLDDITLFDNRSLEKLRKIPLNHEMKCGNSERGQLSLVMDRDVILIRVKASSKTRSIIWRLSEAMEENQENNAVIMTKQKASANTASRPTRRSSRRR